LILLAALGAGLVLTLAKDASAQAAGYAGALSDAHAHVVDRTAPGYFVAAMDRAKVDKIIIMRKEDGVSDEDILAFHESHPDRILPVIGLQTLGWREHRPVFLRKLREKVESGRYRWMGEATLRGQVNGRLVAPPDSPMLHELLEISARYRIPVTIHHNAFDAAEIQSFVDTLARHPEATVVWAHWCGLGDPEKIRSWLAQLPKLHCDLGWMHQDQSEFPNRIVDDQGWFLPAWKALIEAYPDRFLAAINASDAEDFTKFYSARAEKIRQALGGLEPAVARKVATENLHRLLR